MPGSYYKVTRHMHNTRKTPVTLDWVAISSVFGIKEGTLTLDSLAQVTVEYLLAKLKKENPDLLGGDYKLIIRNGSVTIIDQWVLQL